MQRSARPRPTRMAASLAGIVLLALAYAGCTGKPTEGQPGTSSAPPPGGAAPGGPPGGPGGPGGGRQFPAPQLKNIKVLKDVRPEQMIPLMREWSHSLGVRCDHCHIERRGQGGPPGGFEQDGKPEKEMARKMFVMMQGLNAKEKILEGKVTCFTCHHGQAEPESKAPEGFGPGGRGGPGRPGGFGPGRPGGPGGSSGGPRPPG